MGDDPLTIVGVGAHLDDCWLGCGGAALKAARRGHCVTFVTAVSNPRHYPVLAGREAEMAAFMRRQADATGIAVRTLGHHYLRLEHSPELIGEISHVLAELRADIVFYHDVGETNPDHVALGSATEAAALHLECFLPADPPPHLPRELYRFCTGWQSRGFRPEVHVDVTETLFDALEQIGAVDALYAHGVAPPQAMLIDHAWLADRAIALTGHSRFKLAQAIVAGGGWGYAEGFASPRPIFAGSRLARACG